MKIKFEKKYKTIVHFWVWKRASVLSLNSERKHRNLVCARMVKVLYTNYIYFKKLSPTGDSALSGFTLV